MWGKITARFIVLKAYPQTMGKILPGWVLILFSLAPWGNSEEATNAPTPPAEEVIQAQGVKIWKKGKPTNAFTVVGFETLMRQRGFDNAQNNIARGVLSRKGNAAIVLSIINSQRLNFDLNTRDERLDGIDVRYQIISLKP